MERRGFWYFLMAGAIVLYGAALFLGRYLFPHDWLLSRSFFLGLLAVHAAEIPIAVNICRDRGIPLSVAAMKTILFGFTWWLPLKRGIIDR